MALSFTDVILLLGISQGIFLSFSMRLIVNRNKEANNYLSILLLIATVMLFCRFAFHRITQDWVWRFGVLIDTTIFLFGPLIFSYSKRLLFKSSKYSRLQGYDFILPALHLCYFFWTVTLPLNEFNRRFFSGELDIMFFIVELLGITSFTFYLFKSFSLLKKYHLQERNELSFQQPVFIYLKTLLSILTLCLLLWAVSFLSSSVFKATLVILNYDAMWITVPLFIYAIAYYSLRQPEIFRLSPKSNEETVTNRLKPDQIQQLQKGLNYLMHEEKVYINQDLTLNYLASRLDTSTNNLSWFLNQVYQETFSDYINKHRIEAFLEKLDRKEHETHTIIALAYDVGFGSKSTFNRVFKSIIGMTPKDYLKNKKVA